MVLILWIDHIQIVIILAFVYFGRTLLSAEIDVNVFTRSLCLSDECLAILEYVFSETFRRQL